MEPLVIKATDSTPFVRFDNRTGELEISGTSMPEDVFKVYEPIFAWLKAYSKNPHSKTVLSLNLRYFNSATAKIILLLIHTLEPVFARGLEVLIKWGYLRNDEESFESGEDYASMVDIPFKFVEIK